jgi:hypothetical protein
VRVILLKIVFVYECCVCWVVIGLIVWMTLTFSNVLRLFMRKSLHYIWGWCRVNLGRWNRIWSKRKKIWTRLLSCNIVAMLRDTTKETPWWSTFLLKGKSLRQSLRSSLFWDVTKRRLVDIYRHFGTTSGSHLQGPSSWSANDCQPQNCVFVRYYAASSGNFLPTFRYNLSFPSSGLQNPFLFWILDPSGWDR